MSQIISQEAILQLLVEKGIFTNMDNYEKK